MAQWFNESIIHVLSPVVYASALDPNDNHPNSCLHESRDDRESPAPRDYWRKLVRLRARLSVCQSPGRFPDTNASRRTECDAALPTLAIEKPSPEYRAADRFASDCRSD